MNILLYYIILTVVALAGVCLAKSKGAIGAITISYFALQGIGAVYCSVQEYESTLWSFFTFDTLGLTYCILLSGIGMLSAWRSVSYLDSENLRHRRIYFISLILLSASLVGVYLTNNMAVSWIFLEATTICAAGLTYHRRTPRALEATWKYLFVSSVGIAVAYLGVLLFSTMGSESLSFDELRVAVTQSEISPLYLKLAFLLIIVGYSTKLEIIPLFTAPVDANHSAPSPASALISSALVGGGFVAIFRVYEVVMASSQADWASRLLILISILSLVVAAVYMGRTSNYKRLLAYSTVENSALITLGLGLGGVGVYAAVLHSLAHTVIKGVMYLQLSLVGRHYDTYRVGRIGAYGTVDRLGALVLMLGTLSLVAVPPSLLFRSELMLFNDILGSSSWWLIFPIVIPLLACLWWAVSKLLAIVFAPCPTEVGQKKGVSLFSLILTLLLLGLFVFGAVEFEQLDLLIMNIIEV